MLWFWAPRIETHTCCYPARASWFRHKAEFIICSVCVVKWVFGEQREAGRGDWMRRESACSVSAQKITLPLSSTPFFDLHCSTFSRAPLMWGDSEQTLNRARLKAFRGAAHLCVFSCSSFPLSSPRWVWRGFVSNSLVHLHYHHPASQPFPPSFILSFLLFDCLFIHSALFPLLCSCFFWFSFC